MLHNIPNILSLLCKLLTFNLAETKLSRYQMSNQSRQSKKDRKYNDHRRTDKRTNNDVQNTTQKTTDRAT